MENVCTSLAPKKYLLTSLNPLMVLIGGTQEDICGEVICAGGCLLSKVCIFGILRGLLYTSVGLGDFGFIEVDNHRLYMRTRKIRVL